VMFDKQIYESPVPTTLIIYDLDRLSKFTMNTSENRRSPNLSFSGAGFLGLYHIGVARSEIMKVKQPEK
jgi:hypothetical protein